MPDFYWFSNKVRDSRRQTRGFKFRFSGSQVVQIIFGKLNLIRVGIHNVFSFQPHFSYSASPTTSPNLRFVATKM